MRRIAVVGGGPAGLMAAETARAAGAEVDLYERMGSVGRKFLLAGKGGLNLTHSEPFDAFVDRYGGMREEAASWLRDFDADALRQWARGLGVETRVGTSGRVFPQDLKAAPLLRGWLRRLRTQGVRFHVNHQLTGWEDAADGVLRLHFRTPTGTQCVEADRAVLALGGASWPQLGSDGAWVEALRARGVDVADLQPANCGFEVAWSAHFVERNAGQPVKPVLMSWTDAHGHTQRRQGEFVVSAQGVEGGLIYAASAELREGIRAHGSAEVQLDLLPARSETWLAADLARPRKGRSIGEHLRRAAGLDGVRASLLFEFTSAAQRNDPDALAACIKSLPLRLLRPRPIAEAISSAGGVRTSALHAGLSLRAHPSLYCAGEMLDWEAPTGGYLLGACFASGRRAGHGAAVDAGGPGML